MFKFKFDASQISTSEIVDGFRIRFKSAMEALSGEVKQQGEIIAASKLKSGLKHWNRGFKIHKVNDDLFVISVEGKLAKWMEDGIQVGEISDAIMKGNRAQHNKGEGKNYVDVPIAKDADAAGDVTLGKKGGPKVNIRAFANADQLVKYINSSNYKQGGIKQKQVIQSRVKDIIKNVEPKTGETSYLTIRRVTEKSKWPSSPFKGAQVFEALDSYIDENVQGILERFL
jgi:hypothetical protein